MEEKPVEKPVEKPKEETKEEESDSSYYSYSYSEDEKPVLQRRRPDSRPSEDNIFSSLLKSSRKLLDELSGAGVKTESAPVAKREVPSQMAIGGSFIAKDREVQKVVRETNAHDIVESVEKVDNHLTLLVGMMQEEVAFLACCLGVGVAVEVPADSCVGGPGGNCIVVSVGEDV